MDRADLERLDRESLVVRAHDAGVRRARLLTRPELIDELIRLDPDQEEGQLRKTRGFFGRARDLLTKVVERGLHLPDAADRWASSLGSASSRSPGAGPPVPRPEPQVVPTVTLAEIYAAQGHKQRAVDTLRRVLDAEPEHGAARELLERLEDATYVAPPPPLPPEHDEPVKDDAEDEEPDAGEPADVIAEAIDDTVDDALGTTREEPFEAVDTQTLWLPDEAETASFLPGDAPREPEPSVEQPPRAGAEDEDGCVALALDGGQVCYVSWKLSPSTRARLEAEPAFLFLRAASFVPSWEGPIETVHDLTIDPAACEAVVRDLPAKGIVRIAIGTRAAGAFVPLAHSPALEIAGADVVEWTADGVIRRGRLDDPRSLASAKRALAAML